MVVQLPYHPGEPQPEKALDSPEVLVINALVGTGEFKPAAFGLDKEMLASHDKVWQFCADYQDSTGGAPARGLLARKFPDFEQLTGVDPAWAADQLRADHHERTIRSTLQRALSAIHDKDLDLAREHIAEAARPHLLAKPKPMDVYDESIVANDAFKSGWKEPWKTLQEHTHGVGRGELRYVGARLGEGKSWILPVYANALASQGAKVCILTLEIPKRVYARRLHQLLAADEAQRHALQSTVAKHRKAALAELSELKGQIALLDPSDTRMTTKAVELATIDFDVVMIDHVGLLRDGNGKQAIEDWRVMAAISNQLKTITLETNASIIAASQVNREADNGKGRAPRPSNFSQSDALGQDGDVLHMLARGVENGSTMLHDIPKNRFGFNTRFYSNFLPAKADFAEISKDEHLDQIRLDEDRLKER